MEKARELARFVSQFTYRDVPERVVARTKELILDQFGCQLAGSTLPLSKAILEYVRDNKGQSEESTIVNYGLRTSAQEAAFANANFGHAFIGDDLDPTCKAHLGSIIIPAALAVAEREKASGKAFIKAVVAGYEVASRIGAAAPQIQSRGFHPGPVLGPFGVAASAGMMLGMSEDQILDALGIAGSHCSGLMEYSKAGGTVNKLHAGIAACGGIRAALLAHKGFKGPPTVLEGERGFFRAFSGETALEEISRGLGREFKVLGVGLRRYCCCGTQCAGIDAISDIMGEHVVTPGAVERIVIRAPAYVLSMVGSTGEPQDVTGAQFNARFGMALRIVKGGNGFKEYNEANLKDPEVLNLAKRVYFVPDDDLGKGAASYLPARLTVKMRDGAVFEKTVYAARGTALNPMNQEEVAQKFREFASGVLADREIAGVIAAVAVLDQVENICEFSRLLVAK